MVTNDNRTGPRTEINKKRPHDAILRFGILKMWIDIEQSFELLHRTTKKMLFGLRKEEMVENDVIDVFCQKVGKPLHMLHLKR